MKTIKGDLIKLAIEGEFDVIVHGCNCHCTMGSGIAKQIRKEFPGAYNIDQQTNKGDIDKLGEVTIWFDTNVTVVNAYTQYNYGGRGVKYADYDAIKNCMKKIKTEFTGKRIGLPLIGCGLAGGDWKVVSEIIATELDGEDVTIVEFEG